MINCELINRFHKPAVFQMQLKGEVVVEEERLELVS